MSNTNDKTNENPGSRWQRMWRPSRKWYFLWLPLGGIAMFFVGIVVWGGFNTAMEATSNTTFCISCHEMRDNVYPEYQKTIHYKNPAGVQAGCPDCHVPKPWIYKVMRKIKATYSEVPKHLIGKIDTRAKFLAHRQELAESVWATMKSTDSRECRNCHAMTAMDLEKESKSARNKHSRVIAGNLDKTCIDCHKGIAHTLPEDDPPVGSATPAATPASGAAPQAEPPSASESASPAAPAKT